MEGINLIKGNCIEELKDIENESVDCIITDPPYCIGASSNGTKSNFTDTLMLEPFFDKIFSEFKRVLKNGGVIYLNTDWRTYPLLYPIFTKYFKMPNLIVWDYKWIKAGIYYRFRHEFIMYGIKENKKRSFDGGQADIWDIRCINYTNLKTKLHQAQKPIELIEKILFNETKEGDIVLDAFMGSGTTGVACKLNNRKFIGIEIDDKMFEVAKNRIAKAPKWGRC